MRKAAEFLVVVLIMALVAGWYFIKQPQLTVADGKGHDGVTYHKIYLHFKGATAETVYEPPFNKRVGLPWLAAQLPLEETRAFLLINLGSGLLTVLLTYLTLRGRVTAVVLFACLAPLLCYIHSPIRFPNFYPYLVDPPAMLLYAAAAYLLTRRHFFPAVAVLVLSCLFREAGVYFAVGVGAFLLWHGDYPRRSALGLIAFGLSGALLVWCCQLPPSQDVGQLIVVLYNIKHKLLEPSGLLRVIAGVSLTIAPFALCLMRTGRSALAPSGMAHCFAAVGLLLSLVMGAVGGSDTTRIFFTGFPLYALLLAEWLHDEPPLRVALLAVAGMVANYFWLVILDPLTALPINDTSGIFSLTPDHSHISVAMSVLIFWFLCWLLLVGPGWSLTQAVFTPSQWRNRMAAPKP